MNTNIQGDFQICISSNLFVRKAANQISCGFCEISNTTFLQKTSGRLLLNLQIIFFSEAYSGSEVRVFRKCLPQRVKNSSYIVDGYSPFGSHKST